MGEISVAGRSIRALRRNHPTLHAVNFLSLREEQELWEWAASLTDRELRRFRNIGPRSLKWIRSQAGQRQGAAIGEAWAEVEAALPPENLSADAVAGGWDTGPWEIGHLIRNGDRDWTARAQEVVAGGTLDTIDANGLSAAAALKALAALLRTHRAFASSRIAVEE